MRVAILGSGRGSNAEAVLRAQLQGRLGPAKIIHLFSDQPESGFLKLGPRFNVAASFVDASPFKTKLEGAGEERMIRAIKGSAADLIVLAGFMRVLKPVFLTTFAGAVINLHPSLLPSFPGLDAIGQAWRRGVKVTGCTVHHVTVEVDAGPIIAQEPVRVLPEDTIETLTARVHAAEHQLLPSVIAQIGESFPAEQS